MKVVCIVQARMGSERLQGKVIKPILGKPMILYTLERLKKSKLIDEIVMATSNKEIEQPLIEIVKNAGFSFFCGDERDVLKRYVEASEKYNGDVIIRITGDCPLIDTDIVNNVITSYFMYDYDYVRLDVPNTFARGFDVEIFSKEALKKVEVQTRGLDESFREHVTLYMYKNPHKFSIGYVKGEELFNKEYRLCVDTVEDFKLVTQIYKHFKDEYVCAKEVIKYLDRNNELNKINSNIIQKEV